MNIEGYHKPVLVREIREMLQFKKDKIYVDGTVGMGGLAHYALSDSSPTGRLIGLDLDREALAIARDVLAEFGERVVLEEANFKDLKDVLRKLNVPQIDGVIFDLGVSSLQLDRAERGFSFQSDGPLDMRMSQTLGITAKDLVNQWDWKRLKKLFQEYGEERWSERIAKAIVENRNKEAIVTTSQLAGIIKRCVPKRPDKQKIHPATKVFQALRIAVNDELESLRLGLEAALSVLGPGGRVAVITFHSLEDRIVKDYFRKAAQSCVCPPSFPRCICQKKSELKILTKRPITPAPSEMETNPRCRSAKLRVAEKLSN